MRVHDVFQWAFLFEFCTTSARATLDADLMSLSLFQEHNFLMAPSVLESRQVHDLALPSVHSGGGGPHVPSNSATPATTTLPVEFGGLTTPTADTYGVHV